MCPSQKWTAPADPAVAQRLHAGLLVDAAGRGSPRCGREVEGVAPGATPTRGSRRSRSPSGRRSAWRRASPRACARLSVRVALERHVSANRLRYSTAFVAPAPSASSGGRGGRGLLQPVRVKPLQRLARRLVEGLRGAAVRMLVVGHVLGEGVLEDVDRSRSARPLVEELEALELRRGAARAGAGRPRPPRGGAAGTPGRAPRRSGAPAVGSSARRSMRATSTSWIVSGTASAGPERRRARSRRRASSSRKNGLPSARSRMASA